MKALIRDFVLPSAPEKCLQSLASESVQFTPIPSFVKLKFPGKDLNLTAEYFGNDGAMEGSLRGSQFVVLYGPNVTSAIVSFCVQTLGTSAAMTAATYDVCTGAVVDLMDPSNTLAKIEVNPTSGPQFDGLRAGSRVPNVTSTKNLCTYVFGSTWTLCVLAEPTRQALCNTNVVALGQYEKVQKANSSIMALLHSIRYMRKKLPFSGSVAANVLKGKVDVNSVSRLVVCLDSGNCEETYHVVRCVDNVVHHIGVVTGLFTRDIDAERWRLDTDVATLEVQMEIIKKVYNYSPVLLGSGAEVDIEAEEKAALEVKMKRIKDAENKTRAQRDRKIQAAIDSMKLKDAEGIDLLQQKCSLATTREAELLAELEELQNSRNPEERDRVIQRYQRRCAKLREDNTKFEKGIQSMEEEINHLKTRVEAAADKSTSAFPAGSNEERALTRRQQTVNRIQRSQQRDYVLRYLRVLDDRVLSYVARASQHRINAKQDENAEKTVHQSILSLRQIVDTLLPRTADSQKKEKQEKFDQVRAKLLKFFDSESAFFSGEIQRLKHLDMECELFEVQLTILGLGGICQTARNQGSTYTVALNRNGRSEHPPPKPVDPSSGVIKWTHTFTFTKSKKEHLVLSVLEYDAEGNVKDSLPVQVDMVSLTAKEKATFMLLVENLNLKVEVVNKKLERTAGSACSLLKAKRHVNSSNVLSHLKLRPSNIPLQQTQQ
eukprot:PhF_6_TR39660/c0_g1_i1/m.58860